MKKTAKLKRLAVLYYYKMTGANNPCLGMSIEFVCDVNA